MILYAVTGWTSCRMRTGRSLEPLPAPLMENCPAMWTKTGLRQFALGLVSIVHLLLQQTIVADRVKAGLLIFSAHEISPLES
jgi:hypothetical protein